MVISQERHLQNICPPGNGAGHEIERFRTAGGSGSGFPNLVAAIGIVPSLKAGTLSVSKTSKTRSLLGQKLVRL